jgi:hypothetical protein
VIGAIAEQLVKKFLDSLPASTEQTKSQIYHVPAQRLSDIENEIAARACTYGLVSGDSGRATSGWVSSMRVCIAS